MNLIDLQIALRSLAQHTKRSLFLGAAIATVAALLVLLTGLTDGVRESMLQSGSTLMTGHVNVGGFYKPSAGMSAPLVLDAQKVLDRIQPEIAGLDYVVMRGRGYAKAVADTGSMDLVLGGIEIGGEKGFREVVRLVDGKLEDLAQPNTLLIFETQAKRLGVKVGDPLTLSAPTARGVHNTADVRVAAIGKDIGLLSVICAYVPSETLRQLYQLKAGSTGAIQIYLKDYRDSPQVAARLRTLLADAQYRVMDPDPQPYYMKLLMKVNREDWSGQKLDVTTWEDELSMLSQTLGIISALIGLLMTILLFIVAIGIMNTMWIAIRERTREIGTLRAIGMQRRGVLKMFLLETGTLGLLAATFGALVGALLSVLVNALHIPVPASVQMFLLSDQLTLIVHAGSLVRAVLLLGVATALFALFPAIRAARLRPVTAMHHMG